MGTTLPYLENGHRFNRVMVAVVALLGTLAKVAHWLLGPKRDFIESAIVSRWLRNFTELFPTYPCGPSVGTGRHGLTAVVLCHC